MNGSGQKSVGTLCTLGVFTIFAILAVLLTLMGARVYRGISDRMQGNDALRSSLSYVANKVRSGDAAGSVTLEERSGMPVLCLSETLDGTTYETLLFFADGWLREYATVAGYGDTLTADDGEAVTALKSFAVTEENGTLLLWAETESGETGSMRVTPRCRGEVQP